jgi:hypothetical protein
MSALALSLLAAATNWTAEEVESIVTKFRQACMQGQVTFARGQVRPVEPKSLPSEVRRYCGRIANARFYEMQLARPSYLISWERKPAGTYYTRGCAVVAPDLPLFPTWEKVLKAQFTPRERTRLMELERRMGIIEFPLPEEGNKVSIDRVFGGRFVALQVSAMSKYETREWKSMPFYKPEKTAESPKP